MSSLATDFAINAFFFNTVYLSHGQLITCTNTNAS